MANQPIVRVHPKPYQGRDPKRAAKYEAEVRAAAQLEQYLDGKHVEGQPRSLTYFNIARETGIELELVKELLFRARGGNNGITL